MKVLVEIELPPEWEAPGGREYLLDRVEELLDMLWAEYSLKIDVKEIEK